MDINSLQKLVFIGLFSWDDERSSDPLSSSETISVGGEKPRRILQQFQGRQGPLSTSGHFQKWSEEVQKFQNGELKKGSANVHF